MLVIDHSYWSLVTSHRLLVPSHYLLATSNNLQDKICKTPKPFSEHSFLNAFAVTSIMNLQFLEHVFHNTFLTSRSNSSQLFCMKLFWEISEISQQNTCTGTSILIKLQVLGLQPEKRDYDNDIFFWSSWNFSWQTFYRAPVNDCSWMSRTLQ